MAETGSAQAGAAGGASETSEAVRATSFLQRAVLRRRLRFLERRREVALHDLGGFVYESHRLGEAQPDLEAEKLAAIDAIDLELATLQHALDAREELTVLHEPGISSCPHCGTIHDSVARYCPGCGQPREPGHSSLNGSGVADAGSAEAAVEPTAEVAGDEARAEPLAAEVRAEPVAAEVPAEPPIKPFTTAVAAVVEPDATAATQVAAEPPIEPFTTAIAAVVEPDATAATQVAAEPPIEPFTTAIAAVVEPDATAATQVAAEPPIEPFTTAVAAVVEPDATAARQVAAEPPIEPFTTALAAEPDADPHAVGHTGEQP